MAELLEVRGLRKTFGDFVAVDGVDLTVPARRLTSVIGPNGAGKTTVINVVTGLLPADGGQVLLDGEDITGLPVHERVRRGLGRSFQIMTIFPRLSVGKNVLIPVLARRGEASRLLARADGDAPAWGEVDEVLGAVGLAHLRGVPASTVAHGDQRLLEVAMALANRPRLCLLDEPCAGLNPPERRQVLDLVGRLGRETETTFVVVEHDMDVVFAVSEWIVVLNRGTVLAEGPPEAIREDPAVRDVYLGEGVE